MRTHISAGQEDSKERALPLKPCYVNTMSVITSAIFLKKIGSGTQRVIQNSVREGEALVTPMLGN